MSAIFLTVWMGEEEWTNVMKESSETGNSCDLDVTVKMLASVLEGFEAGSTEGGKN